MTESKFYFDPNGTQLEVFLGKTEAVLMEIVWQHKEVTVKSALFHLKDKKKLAYTTVMTILARLHQKELLKRKKDGRNYIYTPVCTKKEFIQNRLAQIKNCLKQFS